MQKNSLISSAKGFQMKKSFIFIISLFIVVAVSGCGDTAKGIKKDTKDNADWGKEKVNEGAKYIEKKTD
jgi:predicted small secreted protein